MTTIPASHISDAHSLSADAEIDLFELTPAGSTAKLYFKADNPVTWQGNLYNGMPLVFTEDSKTTTAGSSLAKLAIGQENIDLSAFKPLVFDGSLDGARIIRRHLLLDDLVNNRNVCAVYNYRVRRVESYSRSNVNLQLAPWSGGMKFSMPFRQYLPPAFPAVSY